ncbi:hypothetical protein B0H15DRAFT_978648 [Mycena belliarum]|uniref:Uncharacterized protein n=1 Tax=Mycena belliarum TaxID=1033014 RepID=A0AAD6XT38_9AGAR|nr:hypothetical protein B0H15DRAFT_978648 [Mycena belliae]
MNRISESTSSGVNPTATPPPPLVDARTCAVHSPPRSCARASVSCGSGDAEVLVRLDRTRTERLTGCAPSLCPPPCPLPAASSNLAGARPSRAARATRSCSGMSSARAAVEPAPRRRLRRLPQALIPPTSRDRPARSPAHATHAHLHSRDRRARTPRVPTTRACILGSSPTAVLPQPRRAPPRGGLLRPRLSRYAPRLH